MNKNKVGGITLVNINAEYAGKLKKTAGYWQKESHMEELHRIKNPGIYPHQYDPAPDFLTKVQKQLNAEEQPFLEIVLEQFHIPGQVSEP